MFKKYFYLLFFAGLFSNLHAQQVTTVVSNAHIDDALIFDEQGVLYGVRYQGSAILSWTPFEDTTSIFSDGYNTPNGMAFDDEGILYMADNEGNTIYKIDEDGNATVFVDDFINPSGLIFELDSDTLIATSYAGNRIIKIAPDGSWSDWSTGGSLNGPVGLCYDDDGRLYTGNFNNRQIIRLSEEGEQTLIGQAPGSQWLGFIAYAKGYIYGTMFNQHTIYRMDLEGNGSIILGSTAGTVDGDASTAKFNAPNGIVATPSQDTLFVSDYNTRALRMITGLEDGTTATVDKTEPTLDWSLSPNPSNDHSYFNLQLKKSSKVTVHIFNQKGQLLIRLLENHSYLAGTYQVEIPVEKLPSGSYTVQLILDSNLPISQVFIKQ